MKIFWFIYDIILMLLTSIVIFVYIIGILSLGLSAFDDFIFVSSFTNLYVGMCAFRLASKYIKDKIN